MGSFRTLDAIISYLSKLGLVSRSSGVPRFCHKREDHAIDLDQNTPAGLFLAEIIKQSELSCPRATPVAVKFILSNHDGFCARSDFLERRLEGCKYVTAVKGFLEPLQEVKSYRRDNGNDIGLSQLDSILSRTVGGIVVNDIGALDGAEK